MMLIRLSRPAHVCLLAVLGCAMGDFADAAAPSLGDADSVTWWNQTEEALSLIALDVSNNIPNCRS